MKCRTFGQIIILWLSGMELVGRVWRCSQRSQEVKWAGRMSHTLRKIFMQISRMGHDRLPRYFLATMTRSSLLIVHLLSAKLRIANGIAFCLVADGQVVCKSPFTSNPTTCAHVHSSEPWVKLSCRILVNRHWMDSAFGFVIRKPTSKCEDFVFLWGQREKWVGRMGLSRRSHFNS